MDLRSLVSRNVAYLRASSTQEQVEGVKAIEAHGGHASALYAAQASLDLACTSEELGLDTRRRYFNNARRLASSVIAVANYTGTHTEESLRAVMLVADLPILNNVYFKNGWPSLAQSQTQHNSQRIAATVPAGKWSHAEIPDARMRGVRSELVTKLLLSRLFTGIKPTETSPVAIFSSLFSEDNSAYSRFQDSSWDVTVLAGTGGPIERPTNKLQVKSGFDEGVIGDVVQIGIGRVINQVPEYQSVLDIINDLSTEHKDRSHVTKSRLDVCSRYLVERINA